MSSREGKAKILSARSNHIPSKPSKVKRVPYLNPDAFYRFIGPKNLGKVLIDDELITCLLDKELNSISLLLLMHKNEEWTSCLWTVWHKKLGDQSHLSEA